MHIFWKRSARLSRKGRLQERLFGIELKHKNGLAPELTLNQFKNGGRKLNQAEIKAQALALCEVLDNKKALDILAVNVADKTIIADWFVIASGHSTTQVKALCDELEEKAAERGLIARRKEGYQEGRWIVVDFGTILVHLFHPEEREYYKLERLWVDDPQHCIKYSKEHAE